LSSGRSGKATTLDILVHKGLDFHESGTIASGSLRRQAQWLNQLTKWLAYVKCKFAHEET
jgi:hypothetical protein